MQMRYAFSPSKFVKERQSSLLFHCICVHICIHWGAYTKIPHTRYVVCTSAMSFYSKFVKERQISQLFYCI